MTTIELKGQYTITDSKGQQIKVNVTGSTSFEKLAAAVGLRVVEIKAEEKANA